MPPATFDASVDLTEAVLPASAMSRPEEAAARVRAAVGRIPGAGWVSVEVCIGAPAWLPWIAVYEPGHHRPRSGGVWSAIAARVEEAVRTALA